MGPSINDVNHGDIEVKQITTIDNEKGGNIYTINKIKNIKMLLISTTYLIVKIILNSFYFTKQMFSIKFLNPYCILLHPYGERRYPIT